MAKNKITKIYKNCKKKNKRNKKNIYYGQVHRE